MKKILSIILASLFCLSITGCWSKDCMKDTNGDEICILKKDLRYFEVINDYSIIQIYKNGKLNDYGRRVAVKTCDKFGEFGRLCRYENFRDGRRHCINGPAVVDFNGAMEYWLDGEKYTGEEFWSLINRSKPSLSDTLEELRKQQEEDKKKREGEIQ